MQGWEMYGDTQHAGLAENVLDHRMNCRTVYMNPVNRYLYWNMNYHVEHHMYPTIPFHALPALGEAVKNQLPEPDPGFFLTNYRVLKAIVSRSLGKLPMSNQGKSITIG